MSIIYGTITRLEAETVFPANSAADSRLPRMETDRRALPPRILVLAVIMVLGSGALLWHRGENPGEPSLATPADKVSSIEEKNDFSASELSLIEVEAKFVPSLETLVPDTGKSIEPDVLPVQVASESAVPAAAEEQPIQRANEVIADEIDMAIERARLSLARGDYQQAIMVLDPLLEDAPKRADYWFLKGSAHLGMGQLEQADMAFAASKAIAPDNVQIAIQQAIVKQEQKDHVAALQILQAASAMYAEVPEIYLNQGYSQLALGAELEARRSFRTFLRMTEDRSLYTQNRLAVKNWLQRSSAI